MDRLRRGYLYGDLDRGLIPRHAVSVSVNESAEFQRLEMLLAAERAARAQEQVAAREEIARLHAVNEALGKAIGLLHDRNVEREPTDES